MSKCGFRSGERKPWRFKPPAWIQWRECAEGVREMDYGMTGDDRLHGQAKDVDSALVRRAGRLVERIVKAAPIHTEGTMALA